MQAFIALHNLCKEIKCPHTGLPYPKDLDSGVMEENDELEDEVKPKSSQVADVQKPVARKRQPVRITIPELRDDSDDDEPTGKKSRLTPAAGKAGLTALLPPPVHAAKKESNRILLPYTLTRKQKPTNTSHSVSAKPLAGPRPNRDKIAKLQSLTSYDNDSDDNDSEPVSFFSLDSTVSTSSSHGNIITMSEDVSCPDTRLATPTVPLPSQLPRTSLNLPAPISHDNHLQYEPNVLPVKPCKTDRTPEGEISRTVSQKLSVDFDAPLTFKGGVSSKKAEYSTPTTSYPAAGVYPSAHAEGGDQNVYYNQPYEETSDYLEATDDLTLQQDNSFLRIQGKKHRGQEAIKIVDIVADNFTAPEQLAKSISEEQQSHRRCRDNLPSGQQKRKHQITYLAFQAKEQELELKNQWADNRLTKKQTQAKYGF